MKPFVKWQGGKRKELDHIRPYIPKNVSNIAEPFCGGAAVAFDREGIAYLNDTNEHLINLYRVLSLPAAYDFIDGYITALKGSPDTLEERYYKARDVINTNDFTDPLKQALSFLIVRQQCFSGMERYNKSGEFNVPWGRYKTFSCTLSEEHQRFLQASKITCMNAIDHLDILPKDTFVFLDPPYLERAGYKEGDGGFDLHAGLAVKLGQLDLPFLLVHTDHDFYRHAYADFKITEVPVKYSQQWKGRERPDAAACHLYITNT